MVRDHIADLIVKIKNASDSSLPAITFPYSKVCGSIADVLHKTGYVKSVEVKGKTPAEKILEIELLYVDGQPRIRGVQRISHLSRRLYQKSKDITVFKNGFGNVILSTPKGVLTDTEAKKQNVGGEVLFKIW
jgi:small subunit ribosomal protein S8